jgi:hypothetical protein
MSSAIRALRAWVCIAIAVAILVVFVRFKSYHKMLFTPEVFGYIDIKNSGHVKKCISVSINCNSMDVGSMDVGPIIIDDDGRFHAPPIEEFDFDLPGDRVSISRIEIRTCNGETVNYEMFLERGEFIPDRTPKAYLIHVYFADNGNLILRAMNFDGRFRDAIGQSEFQKYLDKLSDMREFAKYTQWRYEESIGKTVESP